VVLALLLIALPLLMGAAFAGVAFVLDLSALRASAGVVRSGVSGSVIGLVIGVATLLNIRRRSEEDR
jgi:hypothetical protein